MGAFFLRSGIDLGDNFADCLHVLVDDGPHFLSAGDAQVLIALEVVIIEHDSLLAVVLHYLFSSFKPIHYRHIDVHDNEIELILQGLLVGNQPILGLCNVIDVKFIENLLYG